MSLELIDRAVADLRPDQARYDGELSRTRRNAMVSGIVGSTAAARSGRPSRRGVVWGGLAAGAALVAGAGISMVRDRVTAPTAGTSPRPQQPTGGPFRHWRIDTTSASLAAIRSDRYDAPDGWTWERVETLGVRPVWYRLHRPERPSRLASPEDALAYARSTTPGSKAELASALISVLASNNPTPSEALTVCDALASLADSAPQIIAGPKGSRIATYVVTGRSSDPAAPKDDVTWTVSVDLGTGVVQSTNLRMNPGNGFTTTTRIFTMQQVTEVADDLLTALGSERREWTTER